METIELTCTSDIVLGTTQATTFIKGNTYTATYLGKDEKNKEVYMLTGEDGDVDLYINEILDFFTILK